MSIERALLIGVLVLAFLLLLELTGVVDLFDSVGPAN